MAVDSSPWERAGRMLGRRRAAQVAVVLGAARGLLVLAWLGLVLVGLQLVGGVVLGVIQALI